MEQDEVIREGDLVMTVKLRPCGHGVLGGIFTARKVMPSWSETIRCGQCKQDTFCQVVVESGPNDYVDILRLKKINPPPLSESADTEKEITA